MSFTCPSMGAVLWSRQSLMNAGIWTVIRKSAASWKKCLKSWPGFALLRLGIYFGIYFVPLLSPKIEIYPAKQEIDSSWPGPTDIPSWADPGLLDGPLQGKTHQGWTCTKKVKDLSKLGYYVSTWCQIQSPWDFQQPEQPSGQSAWCCLPPGAAFQMSQVKKVT